LIATIDKHNIAEKSPKNIGRMDFIFQLHPLIQREIGDYNKRIIIGTAVVVKPRWGHFGVKNEELRMEILRI
jgi:hypothetical protein